MANCLILTTGHDQNDARLYRHRLALESAGINVKLVAYKGRHPVSRAAAAGWITLRTLATTRPDVVLFPDPELFVLGTAVARVLRMRVVIDIHEDYGAVALARHWIPQRLRGAAASLARLNSEVGRRLADSVVVAAPHLAQGQSEVVLNLPSLDLIEWSDETVPEPRVVYVGEILRSRGALEMVDLLSLVPGLRLDLIGPVQAELEEELREKAARVDSSDRLYITGRLPYRQAWTRAAGALAGLSLLHDTTAYRVAVPSKLWEYMAVGLPIVASDLQAQAQLVRKSGGGVIVRDIGEAASILGRWMNNREISLHLGRVGRAFYEEAISVDRSAKHLVSAVSGNRAA